VIRSSRIARCGSCWASLRDGNALLFTEIACGLVFASRVNVKNRTAFRKRSVERFRRVSLSAPALALKSATPELERDEAFFAIGDDGAAFEDENEAQSDPLDERTIRLSAPEVVQRRKRASKYVAACTVFCALLLSLGLVKSARSARAESTRASAPSIAVPAQAPQPEPEVFPSVEPETLRVAQEPVAAPIRDRDPKAAKAKTREAQALLDRGKLALAIDASQEAVTLDSEDAEAWLTLGAAHQAKGDAKAARDAFSRCTKESKRGPKYECFAMLR
jgi:tetratricopeptide (TPR) repeat protein